MPQYQLVVRRGPRAGETFELKSQTVIIGRDSTADIIINDPEVSRNHCRLILDRSYYLQDLGSTNGTFVDGSRLGGEPVRLANGQIIQLGSNVTLLHQEIEVSAGIVSTQMIPGEEPSVPQQPAGPASPPAEPPPVFGQPATPPQPEYNPPITPQEQPPAYGGQQAPPPQQPHQPQQNQFPTPDPGPKVQPIQPGSPVDQMRQAYQQQNQADESGGRLGKLFGGFGGNDADSGPAPSGGGNSGGGNSGGGDAGGGGGGGGMPWSNWTQQQWMIAAGVLVLLLLCICCLFVIAVAVALNPDLINQAGAEASNNLPAILQQFT